MSSSDMRRAKRRVAKMLEKEGVTDVTYVSGVDPLTGTRFVDARFSVPKDSKEGEVSMNASEERKEENEAAAPRIRAAAVIHEPAFWAKNRFAAKLSERGVDVVKTYTLTSAANAVRLDDVSLVVCQQGAGAMASRVAVWKGAADKTGARFLSLGANTSGPDWRQLEEWVARTIVRSAPESIRAPEKDALREEIKRLRALVTSANEENVKLKHDIEVLRSELATKNTQCSGFQSSSIVLQDKLAATKQELSDLHKKLLETKEAFASQIEKSAEGELARLVSRYAELVEDGVLPATTALRKLASRARGGSS